MIQKPKRKHKATQKILAPINLVSPTVPCTNLEVINLTGETDLASVTTPNKVQTKKIPAYEKRRAQVLSEIPDGIRPRTNAETINGEKMSASKVMTLQIKEYHARLGKGVKMVGKSSGRACTWRCTDYVAKRNLCLAYECDFDPSKACKVIVQVGSVRATGERVIKPGSVWEHTAGVCSAKANTNKNVISLSEEFQTLLRANLFTPIEELMKQIPYQASKSQVTRARQQIHRKEVLNNPKYYRLLPLYFQALREQHPHSLFDIEFDNHGHFERAIIVFDAVRDIVGYCRNVTGIDAGHSKHVCYTGVVVTLCAQFGCGRTIDIGAAAVTGEKKVEYEWIASKMKHYVSRLLNRPGHLNISDRDKGIPHFTKNFHCWGAKCAWHIRKNVWTQKPVSMCIRMCMSCVCMRCACDTWYMYVMYDSPGCDHGQRQENP